MLDFGGIFSFFGGGEEVHFCQNQGGILSVGGGGGGVWGKSYEPTPKCSYHLQLVFAWLFFFKDLIKYHPHKNPHKITFSTPDSNIFLNWVL